MSYAEAQTSSLLFITQTGPNKQKGQQRIVRKHVMKDIGLSRRKEKSWTKSRFTQMAIEVPDFFNYSVTAAPAEPVKLPAEVPLIPPRIVSKIPSDLTSSLDNSIASEFSRIPDGADLFPETTMKGEVTSIQSHFEILNTPDFDRLWTGRMDPFVRYPIKMNRRTLELVDHIFDERYGNTPPYRDAWLPLGMQHAAAFHQVLANAALNLASLRAKDSVPELAESLYHHNVAVKIATKELADPERSTSDGLLGTIVAFACYSHVIGDQDGWHMHMKAAEDIIERRGGIETLSSNHLLWIVLFWVDIGGCVTEDIQPHFPLPPSKIIPPQQLLESPSSSLFQQISKAWRLQNPESSEILGIMDNMRTHSVTLRKEVERTKGAIYSNGSIAAYRILPLLHRITKQSSTSTSASQQKLDIIRLGCILYFSEIQRLFGIMGIMPARQTQKLKSRIEAQGGDWGALEILKAWALAMACIETNGERRQWFLAELQLSRERLTIESWEEMEARFKDILWYGDVHSTLFWQVVRGVEHEEPHGFLKHGSRFGGYRMRS